MSSINARSWAIAISRRHLILHHSRWVYRRGLRIDTAVIGAESEANNHYAI